jgi:FKBP-type peptidyl-prolyl cis-trans isomerase (trigger factor)
MKLDVYPQVEINDDTRKQEKIETIDIQVSQEEVNNAINSIKKNYADYQDTDTLTLDTVSKILIEYLDKE